MMALPNMVSNFSPRTIGDTDSSAPTNNQAKNGAVTGISAVLATRTISTSVASRPISMTSAGAAIIGEAENCMTRPVKRSGALSRIPKSMQAPPNSDGMPMTVQAVAAITICGLLRCWRSTAISTRINARHKSAMTISAR